MTENIDTYVMPEDSEFFLSEVLPEKNPVRITWEVLSDEEKKDFLSSALREIESMQFIGERAYFFQPLKFPRIARGLPVNFEKAPPEIKRAQVLIAANIARYELYIQKRNKEACSAFGLISENAQEDYKNIIKEKANELLHRWVTNWRKV